MATTCLGARDAINAFKVSLHCSGIWRIALVKHLEKDTAADRLIVRWNRPPELIPGWTPSVVVLVSSVQPEQPFRPKRIDDHRITWIQPPEAGRKLFFRVFFSRPGLSDKDFKLGSDRFIVRLAKKNGEVVWLLVQTEALTDLELSKIGEFRAKMRIHLAPGSREDSLFFARGILVVAEDAPTVRTQPTLYDIPLGKENVGLPVEPSATAQEPLVETGHSERRTGWFLRLK